MNQATQAGQQTGGRLQQVQATHQQRIQGDLKAMAEEEKARFSWAADPKLLDHTLDVHTPDGVVQKSLKQIKTDFTSILPPYMQHHPLASILANTFVALQVQGAQLRAYQATDQVQATLEQEAAAAEPTSNAAPSASKKGKKEDFDLSGLPEM
jgi:hypothetical protein